MKFEKVYIISYMGDDDLRAKRFEIHNRQLDYWLGKGLDVVVLAMNYKPEDYRYQEDLDYIIMDKMRPGPARNVCLEHFYKSDQDFTMIMDNDIILYEGEKYCDSDSFTRLLQEMPIENMEGIDCFEPINPTQTPFSAFFEENSNTLRESLIFKRRPNISGQSVCIRNLAKFGQTPVYYEDWFDEDTGKIIMGEDVDFGIRLIKAGLGVYSCMNFVRKDMGWTVSSWCKNPEARKQSFEQLKEILPTLGIGNKNGKMDWAGFANKYGVPSKLIVSKTKQGSLDEFFS